MTLYIVCIRIIQIQQKREIWQQLHLSITECAGVRWWVNSSHYLVLHRVTYLHQVPQTDVEDNILEGFQIELMDQFFLRPTASLIMFCAPKLEPVDASPTNNVVANPLGMFLLCAQGNLYMLMYCGVKIYNICIWFYTWYLAWHVHISQGR